MKLEGRKVRACLKHTWLVQYRILLLIQDTTGDEPEDLLFPNPNHGIILDDESEDEIDQHKPLGSDSTSGLNEASALV